MNGIRNEQSTDADSFIIIRNNLVDNSEASFFKIIVLNFEGMFLVPDFL